MISATKNRRSRRVVVLFYATKSRRNRRVGENENDGRRIKCKVRCDTTDCV